MVHHQQHPPPSNLLIAASYGASGAYAQVSRDISDQLESSAQQPLSLLSTALLLVGDGGAAAEASSSIAASNKEHLTFKPRFHHHDGDDDSDDDDDDLFAPRLQALSPSSCSVQSQTSSFSSSSSSSSVTQTTRRSRPHTTATDSLVQCFSNIQMVSPKFFQQRENMTPQSNSNATTMANDALPGALIAKGCYIAATTTGKSRSTSSSSTSSTFSFSSSKASSNPVADAVSSPSKRQSLAEMVHSVDLSLFPKPLQRLGESTSPILTRIGNLLTHPGSSSSNSNATTNHNISPASSPNNHNNTTMNESFHTCYMTEDTLPQATMVPSPTPHHHRPYGHSPTRKRKSLDGMVPSRGHTDATNTTTTPSTATTSTARSSLLSLDDASATAKTRSRTASSFQSSRHTTRVIYRLKEGRKGMSQQAKESLNGFLPRLFHLGKKPDPAPSKASKHSNSYLRRQPSASLTPKAKNPPPHRTLPPTPNKIYVLLLEIPNKLFEICPVDYLRDMTVGDVLTKVRTNASDPLLAAQSYRGLLNADTEFSAPMLPISLLLDQATVGRVVAGTSNTATKPLFTALPPNASATECQHIRQILMGHPTLQKFWEKDDPFEPSPAKRQRRH